MAEYARASEPPPVAGLVAAFLIAGALAIVALVRVADWGSGASSATPDPPRDVVQSRRAPDPPSDTVRYYHGQQTAEIDGGGHCSATAWAATSGGDGSFRVELDSGAGAALWLTRNDAARIGIDVGSLNFDEGYRGISGPGQGALVTLAQFRLA